MGTIPVLGVSVAPKFTEVMELHPQDRIVFTHDPDRPDEMTAVNGTYDLTDHADGGTDVEHRPPDRLQPPAARAGPARGRARHGGRRETHMGTVFSRNLLKHLRRGLSGPRPRRHRLHRFAPRAPPARARVRRRGRVVVSRRVPTASAGTTGSARSAATSPTPPPSRRRSRTSTPSSTSCTPSTAATSATATGWAPRPSRLQVADERRTDASSISPGWCRRCPRRRPVGPHRVAARGRAHPPRRDRRRGRAACGRRDRGRVDVVRDHPADRDVCSSCSRCRRGCAAARSQPVAASDVLRAITDGLARRRRRRSGAVDLGAPDVVAYPDLLAASSAARPGCRASGCRHPSPHRARRPRRGAGHHGAVQHRHRAHRVAAPATWSAGRDTRGPRARAVRSRRPRGGGAAGTRPDRTSVPRARCPPTRSWTRPLPLLDVVPLPAAGKAAARLALHRLRAFLPDA